MIKNITKKALGHQLISGSLILFLGNALASFGNYLYHLLMGRMLGPVDYGLLASIISFVYILGVPMMAMNIVVVRYVSALRGQKKEESVAYLYGWLNQRVAVVSVLSFIILLTLLPFLKGFLHWQSGWPFFWVVVSSMLMVFFSVNTAFLQGYLKFGLMTWIGIIQVTGKLLLAVLLVWLGYNVLGAILAFPVGAVLAVSVSTLYVVHLLKKDGRKVKLFSGREIMWYAVPVFFSTLAFTSLYTTDILLVRHFLPAETAGFYAALATLGKVIFFAANPIVMVMFPMVSEKQAAGQDYAGYFGLSLIFVLAIILVIGSLYLLLPKLMINILYGPSFVSAAPFLSKFTVFLGLYMVDYLLVNFYLSIKRTKVVLLPVVFALVQAVLIFLFHQNMTQVLFSSITALAGLLAALLFFDRAIMRQVFWGLAGYSVLVKRSVGLRKVKS